MKRKSPIIKKPEKSAAQAKLEGSNSFLYPVFAFNEMRKGYHIDDCDREEKSKFAAKIAKIGSQTWVQLNNENRHGLGYEIIKREAIMGDSTDFLAPDVTLIAFRCCGKAPMVGYRCSMGVFHILWIDRGFKLYKH